MTLIHMPLPQNGGDHVQSHRVCWAYAREVSREDAISAASGNRSAWRVTIFSRGHVLLLAFDDDTTAKGWVKFFKSLMKTKYSSAERAEKAAIVDVRPFFSFFFPLVPPLFVSLAFGCFVPPRNVPLLCILNHLSNTFASNCFGWIILFVVFAGTFPSSHGTRKTEGQAISEHHERPL
jgi:hypothetical protein